MEYSPQNSQEQPQQQETSSPFTLLSTTDPMTPENQSSTTTNGGGGGMEYSPQNSQEQPQQQETSSPLTTSSKYQEYRNYLQEATSSRPALGLEQEQEDSCRLVDESNDRFLDEGLEEHEPLELIGSPTKYTAYYTAGHHDNDDNNRSFPVPTADDVGFLFTDEDGDDDDDQPIVFLDEQDDQEHLSPAWTTTLSKSKASRAASRKRLLESYVQAFKATSRSALYALSINSTTNALHTSFSSTTNAFQASATSLLQMVSLGDEDDDAGLLLVDPDNILVGPTRLQHLQQNDTFEDEDLDPSSPLAKVVSSRPGRKKRVTIYLAPPPDNDDDHENEESKHEIPEPPTTPPTGHSMTSVEDYEEEDDYDTAVRHWAAQRKRSANQLHRFQITVVSACTLWIASTLLFAMNGIGILDNQAKHVMEAWQDVQETATRTSTWLQELESLQSSVLQQTWNLWQLLDRQCPQVRESVCPANACNVTDLPLQDTWEEWLQFVQPRTVALLYQGENWALLDHDLETLAEQPVESTMVAWRRALWATCGCNAVLAVMAFGILWGIAFPDYYKHCCQRRRILSSWWFGFVYWILVALAWAFGMCFLIGSVLAADVCGGESSTSSSLPSPSSVAKELMGRLDTKSFLPAYWDYHIQGCPSELYPKFVDDRVWLWADLLPTTSRLAAGLEELSDSNFLETCGTSIEPLRNAASTLSLQLCMVTQSLVRKTIVVAGGGGGVLKFALVVCSHDDSSSCCESQVNIRRLLGCDQWYPSYESMVYEPICYQGTIGLVWAT
jgi:hypothetical protein